MKKNNRASEKSGHHQIYQNICDRSTRKEEREKRTEKLYYKWLKTSEIC